MINDSPTICASDNAQAVGEMNFMEAGSLPALVVWCLFGDGDVVGVTLGQARH